MSRQESSRKWGNLSKTWKSWNRNSVEWRRKWSRLRRNSKGKLTKERRTIGTLRPNSLREGQRRESKWNWKMEPARSNLSRKRSRRGEGERRRLRKRRRRDQTLRNRGRPKRLKKDLMSRLQKSRVAKPTEEGVTVRMIRLPSSGRKFMSISGRQLKV